MDFLDSLEMFCNNFYYEWVHFIFGSIADMVFIASVIYLYQNKEKVAWWKIVFCGIVAQGITIFYSNLAIDAVSSYFIFLIEISASVLTMVIVGLVLKVYKKRDYAHFIVSYYLAYMIYMIFYHGILAGSIILLAKQYPMVALTVFLPVFIIALWIAYKILKKCHVYYLLVKITRYRLISALVPIIVIGNTILISSVFAKFQMILSTTDASNDLSNIIVEITMMAIIGFSLTISILAFAAYLFMNMEKVKQQENELMQQSLYIRKLENLQTEMRTFRHDYKNVLASMYVQAQEGNIESIQKYLGEVVDTLDDRIVSSITMSTHLSKIHIAQMKSIVLVKLMELEQEHISYRIEIPNDIYYMKMRLDDFSRCIGILIDNAKEAMASIKDGDMTIVLLQEGECLHVMIKNPITDKPLITRIWEEGYSSKGENRGYGLSSYQRILDRYANVVKQTKIEDQTFSQMFTIEV